MAPTWFSSLGDRWDGKSLVPALEELCRIHDVSLELIESSNDLDELLERILREYERRLSEIPNDVFELDDEGKLLYEDDPKLRGLMLFASQAVALKTRAEAAEQIRRTAARLRESNTRLQEALDETEGHRERLHGIMDALDAGVMIVDASGHIRMVNRAAVDLAGRAEDDLVGSDASLFLGDVPPSESGEVRVPISGDESGLWLVSRRSLNHGTGDEVVLVKDVTDLERAREERHRSERMDDMLRTIGILAHKINNPLTALLGRAQMLRMGVDDPAVREKALQVIEESSRRIAGLIRHLSLLAKAETTVGISDALDMGPLADSNLRKPKR
jgi:PAS domain-containing protein